MIKLDKLCPECDQTVTLKIHEYDDEYRYADTLVDLDDPTSMRDLSNERLIRIRDFLSENRFRCENDIRDDEHSFPCGHTFWLPSEEVRERRRRLLEEILGREVPDHEL